MLFNIQPILQTQIESAAQVIFDSFARDQVESEQASADFQDYLLYMSATNAETELGFVAINENNEVVGALLCCDLSDALSFDDA